jgi:succinate dehydrogenase / fumarate reductase membrane anchor subunit
MDMRSKLGIVRHLGAVNEGAHHFWVQRLTGLAMVPLTIWFVLQALSLVGADLLTFKAWVGLHFNPVLLSLLIVVMFHHGQLGLQVIIEDYVHNETARITSLIVIRFTAILLAASAVFAILRLTFGS